MKNLITKARFAVLALVVSVASFSTPALANNPTNPENPSGVQLKFIGNLNNQPVFQLSFATPVESEFTVTVRDNDNTILYKDVVKGTITSKRFLLGEELGDAAVTFEVAGKKSDKPVVFEISKSSRTVQDVVVNQVK